MKRKDYQSPWSELVELAPNNPVLNASLTGLIPDLFSYEGDEGSWSYDGEVGAW